MITALCFLSLGEGEIRCEQLNMVTKWIADFQAANTFPDEDIAFDVLCGDLNFDNCSPGATLNIFVFCCVLYMFNVFFFFYR